MVDQLRESPRRTTALALALLAILLLAAVLGSAFGAGDSPPRARLDAERAQRAELAQARRTIAELRRDALDERRALIRTRAGARRWHARARKAEKTIARRRKKEKRP